MIFSEHTASRPTFWVFCPVVFAAASPLEIDVARDVGIEDPPAQRALPSCCEDGLPTVCDPRLDDFEESASPSDTMPLRIQACGMLMQVHCQTMIRTRARLDLAQHRHRFRVRNQQRNQPCPLANHLQALTPATEAHLRMADRCVAPPELPCSGISAAQLH